MNFKINIQYENVKRNYIYVVVLKLNGKKTYD